MIVLTLFICISVLDIIYKIVPQDGVTVLSLIVNAVFGKEIMFYYIQVTTMLILVLAANTAFLGFPLLVMIMLKIKKHYDGIAEELKISDEDIKAIDLKKINIEIKL